MDNRIYYIWLQQLFGAGSRLASRLVTEYGSAEYIYSAPVHSIADEKKFSASEVISIKTALADKELETAKLIFDACSNLDIDVTTPGMGDYPKSLLAISDFPVVLYYKGRLPNPVKYLYTAVVGTRSMTDYGRNMAYRMGYGLGIGGAVTVSGMALGSDSMAMAGAMDAKAPVVAVLGCGVDVIYPREHRDMYERTIENGAVMSEYPPGTSPAGLHFPVRNRIISGISQAVVVIEGDSRSGSLITARCAQMQGKKVYAVPGKVGEATAEGPNMLLSNGAETALGPQTILSDFEFLYNHTIDLDAANRSMQRLDFNAMSESSMAIKHIGSRNSDNHFGRRKADYEKSKGLNSAADESSTENKEGVGENIRYRTEEKDVPFTMGGKTKSAPVTKRRGPALRMQESPKPAEKPEEKKETEEAKNQTTAYAMSLLDENDLAVYGKMVPNVPVQADMLVSDELGIGDIMSAMSTLEMAGLVESSAGGYYTRTSEELPSENG